ncbi:MAG: hypothetical protein GY950_33405, partial [bacterium]|nr:hypothetical protein [bacterium]
DFYEGCFAAGTNILIADGSSKEIEASTGNGDERVKTGSGEILNVIGTTRGTEPLPMIRIKDEKGGDVLITDGHPVFTVSRGVVLAGNLKKGDIVKRIDGNAKITSITYEAYDGMVYNLRLGSLEGGGRDKTSLFANGILMGDNMMQRYYGRLDKQKDLNQKNVLERGLPKEWLKDYQHSESKKHE